MNAFIYLGLYEKNLSAVAMDITKVDLYPYGSPE